MAPARPSAAVPSAPTILVDVDVPWAADDLAACCETAARRALAGAAPGLAAPELSILVTDDDTVRELNQRWRAIDKPTNVLSFPQAAGSPSAPLVRGARGLMLGDIAVALPTVEREAAAQGKSLADHLHHLVVHGVLHLLGYDHETDADADVMEALEVRILAAAGIADPYRRSEDGKAA